MYQVIWNISSIMNRKGVGMVYEIMSPQNQPRWLWGSIGCVKCPNKLSDRPGKKLLQNFKKPVTGISTDWLPQAIKHNSEKQF